MSSKINNVAVFIAISPSHISSFQSLIKFTLKETHLILLNPGNFNFNEKLWDKVVQGDLNLRYRPRSFVKKALFQIEKLKGYKRFYIKAKNIIGQSSVNLYFCHFEDVITNHFANELLKNNQNEFYVVEDGILNYYMPKVNYRSLFFKKILCSLIGLKFKIFYDHPTQIFKSWVNAQYVRMPEKAICPDKSIFLPFEPIDYQPNSENVLIIGQDIRQEIDGKEEYSQKLEKLFNHVLDKVGDRKIYYKPHRNGDVKTAENLLKKVFGQYLLYDDPTPVEECLGQLLPKNIFSFESTAILNIKLALKRDNVNLYVFPYMDDFPEIGELYKNLEISILNDISH
ncbi:hypothetical protein [Allomuricauda sp. ARW1Y1]|jgi:hypothetical protein|uniref:hypothetical protein n=1 Tax=Allomuricauda sp. ARW1Y1 TaxID=2663843 RepID=UPI0015CA1CBE|nr:hypothetical protein [Muricauda sp. ARW1Y1]NYJ26408.1 hypothetical protein [Muricauda sp. ARW1Y1]